MKCKENNLLYPKIKRYDTQKFIKDLSKLLNVTECVMKARLNSIISMRLEATKKEAEYIELLLEEEQLFESPVVLIEENIEYLSHNEAMKLLEQIEDEESSKVFERIEEEEAIKRLWEKVDEVFNKHSHLSKEEWYRFGYLTMKNKEWGILKLTYGLCGEEKISYNEISVRLKCSGRTIENMRVKAVKKMSELIGHIPGVKEILKELHLVKDDYCPSPLLLCTVRGLN